MRAFLATLCLAKSVLIEFLNTETTHKKPKIRNDEYLVFITFRALLRPKVINVLAT